MDSWENGEDKNKTKQKITVLEDRTINTPQSEVQRENKLKKTKKKEESQRPETIKKDQTHQSNWSPKKKRKQSGWG